VCVVFFPVSVMMVLIMGVLVVVPVLASGCAFSVCFGEGDRVIVGWV
jgi:hypothetical protein